MCWWYTVSFIINTPNKSLPLIRSSQQDLIKTYGMIFNKTESIDHIEGKSNYKNQIRKKRTAKELREKYTKDEEIDVNAILAIINNHQTKIDDHRIMINNIINGSHYSKTVQQAFSNHYSNTGPKWSSWRDITILSVSLFVIDLNVYVCLVYVKLKPLDCLISAIAKRHHAKQAKKQQIKRSLPPQPIPFNIGNISYPQLAPNENANSKHLHKPLEEHYAVFH
ncbi:unnamed protein product [Rotaria sp. Silwood2]|nr:unnamed protein product [Rotaria sp. Silwood2]CAF3286657.1 unnamed protein product [Rotaria sp. Silwood2]CAF3410752.1 unnamed protein product [Rotaria sp. Silwood2]CAF4391453.1 unnamed protein product [Rotaria sp. Silwood2]CAF4396741.1 unnamed protein product [Rotaria sp. Silwood2]